MEEQMQINFGWHLIAFVCDAGLWRWVGWCLVQLSNCGFVLKSRLQNCACSCLFLSKISNNVAPVTLPSSSWWHRWDWRLTGSSAWHIQSRVEHASILELACCSHWECPATHIWNTLGKSLTWSYSPFFLLSSMTEPSTQGWWHRQTQSWASVPVRTTVTEPPCSFYTAKKQKQFTYHIIPVQTVQACCISLN